MVALNSWSADFSAIAVRVGIALAIAIRVTPALAQQGPQQGNAPSAGRAPGTVTVPTESGEVVVTPGSTESMQIYVPPPGYPMPGVDINQGLPESSRPRLNPDATRDGFDLAPRSRGPVTVQGDKNAEGILESSQMRSASVPQLHT